MKPLPIQFKGRGEMKGYIFTQLEATDLAYFYMVEDGIRVHYEVFNKRINHRFDTVSYPTSKAFGIWAWCYSNSDSYLAFEKAIKKYNKLNELGGCSEREKL